MDFFFQTGQARAPNQQGSIVNQYIIFVASVRTTGNPIARVKLCDPVTFDIDHSGAVQNEHQRRKLLITLLNKFSSIARAKTPHLGMVDESIKFIWSIRLKFCT